MAIINGLFINSSILISSLFLGHLVFKREVVNQDSSHLTRILYGCGFGGMGILLMLYSYKISDSIILDLRGIPIILATLYGGPVASAACMLVLAIARIFLFPAGASTIVALFGIFLTGLGSILLLNLKLSGWLKFGLMLLANFLVIGFLLYLLIPDWSQLGAILVYWGIINASIGMFANYFVLYLRHTINWLTQLEHYSTKDPLTGLNNVRQFDTSLNSLLMQMNEMRENLSLLLIDIDYFKRINDTYGHPVGDKVLVKVGEILNQNAPPDGTVCRNGGEEFSILLPYCGQEQALEIAEHIRKAICSHTFNVSKSPEFFLTVSIGVGTYTAKSGNPGDFIEKTDCALYQAKYSGRNRVCSAG